MIKRTLSDKVLSLSQKFPVISITGPRQSGKTTFTRMVFKEYDYASLEEPDEREFAQTDPRGFLRRFPKGVIFDEIQRAPKLLSYIQGIVDREDIPGRYILTSSQQFHLLQGVSQTLAGRTAIVHLLPFSITELFSRKNLNPYEFDISPDRDAKPGITLENILYKGLYPRIHDKDLNAHDWLSAYYRTYVERDVRDIINIGNLDAFQRFIRLCAGRTGQLLNLSSLAFDCGISHTTARQWISVLQAGFIIYLLPPHYANFSKRLIKSPKLYFLDPGLLCYLLRIREPADVLIHPLRGGIFETFILSEIYKAFAHTGEAPPLYFWRDRTGHEIDLIIDKGKGLIPIEIKSGETVADSFFNNLNYFLSLQGNTTKTGVIVYAGETSYKRNKFLIRTWFQCS